MFIQVGNATVAKEAIDDGADVVVAQGTDAGGHQYVRGMGVVPLLAETRKLVDEGDYDVAVFAAGGIANGKGVAAMLALGKSDFDENQTYDELQCANEYLL